MKNRVQDVRNHLVEMMEKLNDGECTDAVIKRAEALAPLAEAYTRTVVAEIKAREILQHKELPACIQPSTVPALGNG